MERNGVLEDGTPLVRTSRFRRARRRVHFGGFRSVQLNVVGWSALASTGIVLGVVMKVLAGVTWLAALPVGIAAAWLAALVVDYRRWRKLEMSVGLGVGPAEMAGLAQSLVDSGLRVACSERIAPDGEVQTRIVFPQAIEKKVRRHLRDHGVRPW